MGNHNVGRSMANSAKLFWKFAKEPTREDALAALDLSAENFHGADAEFDDELFNGVDSDLGRLVALAFDATPEEAAGGENEDTSDPWHDGPYQRFRERYSFC